jgi:type I restriction enzyme M protein
MNAFLHKMKSNIILGDALTSDAEKLSAADVILANPPFGAKAGSARKSREDIKFSSSNKQLAFLQHIFLSLKPGGRAAVVLPDNVLFEDGVGRKIRQILMDTCNLHTILRLPTGIFYSAGVKTNVLFFRRGETDVANTKRVWIYDMRSDSQKYSKKRPLMLDDFASFERLFGNDPEVRGDVRTAQPDGGVWRSFSRQEIADRDDNLDISLSAYSELDPEDILTEPSEIADAIIVHLREALVEMTELSDQFESSLGETL